MSGMKKISTIIGVGLLLLIAGLLLYVNNTKSLQANLAQYPKIIFEGEWKLQDGQWNQIVKDQHIPATKGNVVLRGRFYIIYGDDDMTEPVAVGIPIALYSDHISITITEEGLEPVILDCENPQYGSSACGISWVSYSLQGDETVPVEINIHNPHQFGNEKAIDEMLAKLSGWINIEFEKDVLSSGEVQRQIGFLFIIISFILLGVALFSIPLRLEKVRMLWLIGFAVFFAGGYMLYGAEGISFWNSSIIFNTTALGICMMLYMLFILGTIVYSTEKTKKIGIITNFLLGIACATFFIIPVMTEVLFYDLWAIWGVVQFVANIVMTGCLVAEFFNVKTKRRWIYIGEMLLLLSFCIDFIATVTGLWKGGLISAYMFIILFFASIAIITQILPESINATIKANKLEAEKKALDAELAQSRVATMISQIRPHFIYNTLGSIEQLCELDPPKAARLVHDFSKYLRGNFGELDNPKPITMSQEMEHVKHYVNIEKVRFPDMEFEFELNTGDFRLPALTIQPIVENAIKHGLMKLQNGGKVWVRAFETPTHYNVCVEDDGAGFDTEILLDHRKHIGLRNIRGRLEAMVGGSLEIESTPGKGTKVVIMIPKEETE